jgi:hypothetical protein
VPQVRYNCHGNRFTQFKTALYRSGELVKLPAIAGTDYELLESVRWED